MTEERRRDEAIRLYADLVRNVPIGLSVWAAGDREGESPLRLAAFNPAAEARGIQQAEHRALEMIASGEALAAPLSQLVLAVEVLTPPAIGSILLLDEDQTRVRHGAAPHLPDAFNRAIDGAPIGPSAGSCGTAAFRRAPVFVADIQTDPLWDSYRDLARDHSLRACWSTPILATDGRVLGTFALYYREPRSPTEAEVALIARITHVARIAIERRQLEDQLRALSAHVESVREDERTGIAREIHDELGQALTALRMDLSWIARRVSGPGEGLPPHVLLDKIKVMTQMTDDLVNQVRRISAELRPGVLDDLGLVAGLEWQAQEFERRSNVACSVRSDLGELSLDRSVSTAIFRIFQEALTNVARHASARRVEATLEHVAGEVVLRVRDDGKGIASGRTVSQIAADLSLSVKTVSTHRTRILKKMNMHTNAELMQDAMRARLVQ